MNTDIQYSGFSTTPSDYIAPDGSLAAALNIIPEDGALRPLHAPQEGFPIEASNRLFLHKTADYTHFIEYCSSPQGTHFTWIADSFHKRLESPQPITPPGKQSTSCLFPEQTVISIAAIGHLLMVSTDLHIHYIRFNAQQNSYVYLGTQVPEINLDFALKLSLLTSQSTDNDFTFSKLTDQAVTTPDDQWTLQSSDQYEMSGAELIPNGTASNMFVYYRSQNSPLDPAFSMKKGVEYKLEWYTDNLHIERFAELYLYGKRPGSDNYEPIPGLTLNLTLSGGSTSTKASIVAPDDYTDLYYIVRVGYAIYNAPENPSISGRLGIFSGITHSTDEDTSAKLVIDYTDTAFNQIAAQVNKFINGDFTEKKHFIYPFLLRYAIRLYDGSIARTSAPILLTPNSGYVPAIAFFENKKSLFLAAFAADLRYRLINTIPEEWTDLIAGIDIYVSSPIWPYDQGQEFDSSKTLFQYPDKPDSVGLGELFINDIPADADKYHSQDLATVLSKHTLAKSPDGFMQLSPRQQSDIMDSLKATANFYLIKSLNLEEIKKADNFTDISLDKGILSSLPARPVLDNDYTSYPEYQGAMLKAFNSRLHICHASTRLPLPPYMQRNIGFDWKPDYHHVEIYITLHTDQGDKIVMTTLNDISNSANFTTPWFFYPDSRAYKVTFRFFHYTDSDAFNQYSLPLTPHDNLEAAYWAGDSITDYIINHQLSTDSESDIAAIDNLKNLNMADSLQNFSNIFISLPENPFAFKLSSIVDVPASEVFCIESAARPLSQGQFGQFPMYAFTSEGIWALETSSEGKYLARQPITRDLCTNINAVTQLDNAVLFPSDRGIMLLSGSSVQCITDAINSEYTFNPASLPQFSRILEILSGKVDSPSFTLKPFSKFLEDCNLIYDYIRQRIILYSPSTIYAYIYSITTTAWAMIYSDIQSKINSYPQAMAISAKGYIVDFSAPETNTLPALLITRPLKLGAPDSLKTIDTVIQRGYFLKGNIRSILYASRDLANWHLVWSSQDHYLRGFNGTPYKYFRIACLLNLAPHESISGASINFNLRQTNQLR